MEELDPIISDFLLATVAEDKYINYVSIFNSLKEFNDSDFYRSGFETGDLMSRLLSIMADNEDRYDSIMQMDREVIMYINSTLTLEGIELDNDNGIFITARLLEAILLLPNVDEGLENPILSACETLNNDNVFEFSKALAAYGSLTATEYYEAISSISQEFLNRLRKHFYNRTDVENDDSTIEAVTDYASFIADLASRYKIEELHIDKEILTRICASYKDSYSKNFDVSKNPLPLLSDIISFIENYINSQGKLWIRRYPYDFGVLALMLAQDINVDPKTLTDHAYNCGLYRLTSVMADIEDAEELKEDTDVLNLAKAENRKREICKVLVMSFISKRRR